MPATLAEQRMAELEKKYGKYRNVTLGREFVLPSGVKETYSPSGDFVAKELPPHYTNNYLPADQKKLERFYKERSDIATDPSVNEDERQQAIDKVDAMISKVPRITPMMKQPSAQQKAESQLVTIEGNKYFYDGKTLKPLETDKAVQEQQQAYNKTYETYLNGLIKNDEYAKVPTPVLARRARMFADQVHGRAPDRPKAMSPKLDELWQVMMNQLDSMGTPGKRAVAKEMPEVVNKYVQYAMSAYGMEWQEAMYDVMLRWENSTNDPDDPFNWLLPKMSDEDKRVLSRSRAEYIKNGSTHIKDLPMEELLPEGETLRRGEGKVTVGDKTATVYQGQIQYNIGDIVEKGGKKWEIVGFDNDGEPIVEEVK